LLIVAHRAGLPRQAAAGHRAHHVVLMARRSRRSWVDQHAQHRPGEIDAPRGHLTTDAAGRPAQRRASDRVHKFLANAGLVKARVHKQSAKAQPKKRRRSALPPTLLPAAAPAEAPAA